MITQVNVSQDGKYANSITITGPYWKLNGSYTVKVEYGPPNVTALTSFVFQNTQTSTSNVSQLKDSNSQQTFNINYEISGGSVKTMTVNSQNLSMIVSINSASDGTITLQLPRDLIDAKTISGQDTEFNILIDGAEVKPQSESANGDYRTLTVQFLQGDQDIQIKGTTILSLTQQISSQPVSQPTLSSTTNSTTLASSTTPEPIQSVSSKIPHWVKTLFNLYGQGQVSDDDLTVP